MAKLTAEDAAKLSDEELVDAVEHNVYYAALISPHRHSDYDANCMTLYREADARGNDGLYDRGYKRAERYAA